MTFKSFAHWFQNTFWYHYKWHAVALLGAALFVVSFVVSLAGQEQPDFSYIVAFEGFAGDIPTDQWDGPAGRTLADGDGDGKVLINAVALGFDDSQFGMANRIKYTAELTNDNILLLVLDEAMLAGLGALEQAFLPLSELGLPSEPGRPCILRVEPPNLLRQAFPEGKSFYLCVKALTPERRADQDIQARYEQAAAFARMLSELS